MSLPSAAMVTGAAKGIGAAIAQRLMCQHRIDVLICRTRTAMQVAVVALCICTIIAPLTLAEQRSATSKKRSTWEGHERISFSVDGRACILVVPKHPADGKPWIWRMEFFGHEPQADCALLEKGFHLAYMDVQDMYGAPIALNHLDRFYDELTAEYHLSPKAVLEGFSRGGLFSLNWAARNPKKVACIYNDAPVCDFKSWPGGKGRSKRSDADWKSVLRVYGLSENEALRYTGNPIDNLAPLAKTRIPLLHICGTADELVPYEENTGLLATRYQQLGGEIKVIQKVGVGHHPHSLKDPTPIVDFILSHTVAVASSTP